MLQRPILALACVLATLPLPIAGEDLELRDLDVAAWDCLEQVEGTAKTPDAQERNRMKNRSPIELTGTAIEALDTAGFLKKVHAYDAELQAKRRGELSEAKKEQLASFEKQLVSLTGWLVLAYTGPSETTNCASPVFHDWHFEIFEQSSDHPPKIGDPTPIICEITPRVESDLYRAGVRIQALAGFFRLQDKSFRSTGHAARKIRVTGYLMWDDEHNGKADVGPTVQNFSSNGLYHPWRSTAWEIHPILKIETVD